MRCLALLLLAHALCAASLTDGALTLTTPDPLLTPGQPVAVTVAFAAKQRPEKQQRALDGRTVSFWLLPYRFTLYGREPIALTAQGGAGGRYSLAVPADLPPAWYLLVAATSRIPADDPGRVDEEAAEEAEAVGFDLDPRNGFAAHLLVGVRAPGGAPVLRLSTERARCVFAPGELARVFVSGRGKSGVEAAVEVALEAVPGGTRVALAAGALTAAAGGEATVAFDIDTAPLPTGRHDLVLLVGGKPVDRYGIALVDAPAGAKARWWHGLPFGNSPGFDQQPASPVKLAQYANWIDGEARGVHAANLWVQIFADSTPIGAPLPALPGAGDADMPPTAAERCPANTHAMYQQLMARGIALAVMLGGGELGSENYNPIPTIDREQIALVARKYLAGALSLAQYPHFTGVYADGYGRPEWHGEGGKGEVAESQVEAARKAMYEAACRAAGLTEIPPPPFDFGDKKEPMRLNQAQTEPKLDGARRKAWSETLQRILADRYAGDPAKLDAAPQAEKLAVWKELWKAAGVDPAPTPKVSYPMPRPDGVDLAAGGADAVYRYTGFVIAGIERCYTAITAAIEGQLPGVFTIHNHNRENHRQPMVYAWRDWTRSPSVAGDHAGGASVLASSEWNLDAEPQSYLLSAETLRPQLDRGRPVWRTAAFSFNGSQTRFLRDAVHLAGRGMGAFFHTPNNATWAHQGADQSSYAARDRLKAVAEFMTAYEGAFDALEPVREVAYYLRPGWGDENSVSIVSGLPAIWMSGHQGHVVTHSQLGSMLERYRVLLAPGLPGPPEYDFERTALQRFVAKGGVIIGAPAGSHRYQELVDLAKFGIRKETYQEVDKEGKPRVGRDGKPVMKERWVETLEQRAAATRAAVWKDFPTTEVLPIDFGKLWAVKDETGEKVAYGKKSHWTGFHMWANAAVAALDYHTALKAALDKAHSPLVVKDQPEVFVHALRPRDPAAKGTWLFAANFTVPKDAAWTSKRVPWFFWPTYAEPRRCVIKVKADGIGAVYDLMGRGELPTTREGDRIVFTADLTDIEARVFALLPEAVAGATLHAPSTPIAPGSELRARFVLKGASGAALPALGNVRVRLLGADNAVLAERYRALPADGALPALRVPLGATALEVVDTVAGFVARAALTVAAAPTPAKPAPALTLHRGDAIHAWLRGAKGVRVVWAAKQWSFKDDVRSDGQALPDAARDQRAAQAVATALSAAGIPATAVEAGAAIAGPLHGHPWTGGGGVYRSRWTVPNVRIAGPVIMVGSLSNPVFAEMERTGVAPRSFAADNAGPGRAVVAFLPRAFAIDADAVAIAAADDAGFAAGATALAAIAKADPGADPFYAARERVRWSWVPVDVQRIKSLGGVQPPAPAAPAGAQAVVEAKKATFRTFAQRLAPHVFAIDASAGGVAVALTTLDQQLVLLGTDGAVKRRFGGGALQWPRDVAIAADGATVAAGFALGGELVAWGADGAERWRALGGMVRKDDPFAWDTFKDSERFLAASPDHTVIVTAAGKDGIVARDAASGTARWTVPTAVDPGRPEGPSSSEIAFSPEGRFVLARRLKALGGDVDKRLASGDSAAFQSEDVLIEVASGKVVWAAPADVADWELYGAVGPEGAWALRCGRGSSLSIRDEKGAPLRVVRAEQLPADIAVGRGLIPPLMLTGAAKDRLVMAKPETRTLYVMALTLGNAAQRLAAQQKTQANEAAVDAMEKELRDREGPKRWSDEKTVDAFLAKMPGPPTAKDLIAFKMKRFDSERRAGRSRDFRYVQDEFETWKRALAEEALPLIEQACRLAPVREIALPGLLHHAVVDPAFQRVFVGLWDGTVRAYDLASGKELWSRPVVGGCRLALVGDALYAGGARGDVYRFAAATGAPGFVVNVVR